jgi:hypothetical protein
MGKLSEAVLVSLHRYSSGKVIPFRRRSWKLPRSETIWGFPGSLFRYSILKALLIIVHPEKG